MNDYGLFEVALSWKNPDQKFRSNVSVFVAASTAERAIELAKAEYPNEPAINQVIRRNRFGTRFVIDK